MKPSIKNQLSKLTRFILLIGFLGKFASIGHAQNAATTPLAASAWQVICRLENKIATAPADRCRMAQTIVTAETETPLLLARIYVDPEPLMLLSTPLNIFLKSGLTLSVDGSRSTSYAFEVCNEEGCHLGIPMDTNLVNAFKRGNIAEFTYADATGARIVLPMSLTGFTRGWGELEANR